MSLIEAADKAETNFDHIPIMYTRLVRITLYVSVLNKNIAAIWPISPTQIPISGTS